MFSRQELLQKAKDRFYDGGDKEKAAEYYIANKDDLKEMQEINTETFQKKENNIWQI